jgi:enamine deaminase RidA (YjgF/YER057c/UK114 family)
MQLDEPVSRRSYDYSSEAYGLVFTAGACPLDAEGKVVAPGDHEAQARRAADNLLAALAERGLDAGSLLKPTIYVVGEERAVLVRLGRRQQPARSSAEHVARGLVPELPRPTGRDRGRRGAQQRLTLCRSEVCKHEGFGSARRVWVARPSAQMS